MFSILSSRPKAKSFRELKNGCDFLATSLNSAELWTFDTCFSKAWTSHTFTDCPSTKTPYTYRAVSPGLERAVVAGLDGLNGDVLVPVQRRHNRRLVSECDLVVRVGREEALKESSGGVKDCRTLAADLHADSDLLQVDEVRVNAADVGRRTGIKIEVPEVLAELKGLDLWIMSDG